MSSSLESNKALMRKVIDVIHSPDIPNHHDQTLTLFCKFCQDSSQRHQAKLLHALINNKLFINSIIKHFKQFNNQILNVQKSSSHTFNNFMEILNVNKDVKLSKTEYRIEHCLVILININESAYSQNGNGAQIRSIFDSENSKNNLFDIISKILSHCKLHRLKLSNKLFRFLQHMLPPINTSKSKKFCSHFDIPLLIDRICTFLIYRMHIDGNGDIDNDDYNYNDLYGIKMSLPTFIDSAISIITYFISSKRYKKYIFNHPQITSCIATLCIRLCHEIQQIFNLKVYSDSEHVSKSTPKELQAVLNKMTISFRNNEYIGHNLVIGVAMEYLYYYSLQRDIKLVKIPLGEHGKFEPFEASWHEYQYVVALIRKVTNNKVLGLYLDTIANKLGYAVFVEEDMKNKNKKELDCHKVYNENKMRCFYIDCKKLLDVDGGKNKLRKCKGCKAAFYCNTQCQKMDWKYHKQICKCKESIESVDKCNNSSCCKKDNLRRCTGCYHVSYCSVKCQTDDWKSHKKQCKNKRKQKRTLMLNDDC